MMALHGAVGEVESPRGRQRTVPVRRRRRPGVQVSHPGIPGAENYWFPSQGEARRAALRRAAQMGPGFTIRHHPRPAVGLPHYHLLSPSGRQVSGHYFYGRRMPRRIPPRERLREGEVPGHSLTGPGRKRVAPARPEDEADLFNAGEAGHERIEFDALTPLGVDPRIVAQVYFGNWQRDYSQLLAPVLSQVFRERASILCDLIFQIVDILAEARFGQRLNRQRFGSYRWEEHLDNPREYGIALDPLTCRPIPPGQRRVGHEPDAHMELWSEGRGALPRYLILSQQYVLRQIALAMQHGRSRLGLEHFGNAMHTVEDHYAHSNFIEIGLNHLTGRGDPRTGHIKDRNLPIRDSRGRYRLTTGIFRWNDTLVSLQKLLLHQIEGRPPGSPPSEMGNKVIRVLVGRLLGQGLLAQYDRIMEAWESTGIPEWARRIYGWTGLPDLQRSLEELVLAPLRLAVARLLRPLADAAARRTGNIPYPTIINGRQVLVIEISHSQLAKDDAHHRYHGMARQLAIQAVRDFWREIEAVWSRRQQPAGPNLPGTRFPQLVERYMNHPLAAGDWWIAHLGGRRTRPVPQPTPAGPRPLAVLDRFGFDQSGLRPAHLPLIERAARELVARWDRGQRAQTVRLVGHTDSSGAAAYNLSLGRRRAAMVGNALARAIDRLRPGLGRQIRFQIQSRGEAEPAASNSSETGRAGNRRVQIYLA
jgi:hypothetical protein